MTVRWYMNTGTDAAPTWVEITDTLRIHFTGAGSTASLAKPVVRPSAGYVWPEEVWIGPDVMAGGTKVVNWKKPSAATQAGKVFKIVFSEALNSAPVITAYDDSDFALWSLEMLAGTEQTNWTGLIKCFCTGTEAANTPPAAGWAKQETGHAGSGNPNSLQGSSQYVTVPSIPGVGGNFTFTLAVALPSDADYGKEGKYDPVLAVAYVHV